MTGSTRKGHGLRSRLIAVLAVAGSVAVYTSGAIGGTASSTGTAATPSTKVTATFTAAKTTLSKTSVDAGSVTFTLINRDKAPRTLRVAGQRSPADAPGKRLAGTLTLQRPARYECIASRRGQ
jgi:hypothetical protein